MGTAVSSVDICNLALDLLKHNERIVSIESPNSTTEALAQRWYDVKRRSVLESHPWNFARTRASISRNAIAPAFGYADAYNLPNDFVALVFVGDKIDEDYETDFVVEGNQIVLDNDGASVLNICYIRDITSVPRFSPLFVELLAAELAVVFANSITGLNKSISKMEAIRDRLEVKARAKNGQANPPRQRYKSQFLKNRGLGNTTDGVHLFPQS